MIQAKIFHFYNFTFMYFIVFGFNNVPMLSFARRAFNYVWSLDCKIIIYRYHKSIQINRIIRHLKCQNRKRQQLTLMVIFFIVIDQLCDIFKFITSF